MTSGPAQSTGLARGAAVMLVLVQCATLAWLEGGYTFGGIAAAVAVASLWDRLRIDRRQAPHWLWFVLLAIILIIKHRFSPERIPSDISFVNTSLAYEIARFLIFLQAAQLYVRRSSGRLPTWAAGVAIASMIFASDVRLHDDTRGPSMLLCLLFVAAFGWYAASSRRLTSRVAGLARLGLALTLGVGALAGWGTARLLSHYESKLESLIEQGALGSNRNAGPGFSGSGEIGEIAGWKQNGAEETALRVISKRQPGYLRGSVFDAYEFDAWLAPPQDGFIQPGLRPAGADWGPREELFQIALVDPDRLPGWEMAFRPATQWGARLFLPRDVMALRLEEIALTSDPNGLISRSRTNAAPYVAYVSVEPLPAALSAEDRVRLLAIRSDLLPVLQPMADEVFAGKSTPAEKFFAVQQFFRLNFRYDLRAHSPRHLDAVEYFLRERPSGHCEYFASAGALLLRAAGVPTRYVTGYVATEWNDVGDFWVARRRDAHAWIEAFDEQNSRWVTVECTPEAGVPSEQEAGVWRQWLEAQQHRYEEWALSMSRDGILAFIEGVVSFLVSAPGLLLTLLALVAWFVWHHTLRATQGAVRGAGPQFPALHRLLARADRNVRKLGFERRPQETLSAFAGRLRAGSGTPLRNALADWYEEYVRVRYGEDDPAFAGPALARRLKHLQTVRPSSR